MLWPLLTCGREERTLIRTPVVALYTCMGGGVQGREGSEGLGLLRSEVGILVCSVGG